MTIRALALIAAVLAVLFVLRHVGDRPQLMVDAAVPSPNAPLTLPTMVCHVPSRLTGPCDFKDCSTRDTGELA